jgi:HlyD family secretion protein
MKLVSKALLALAVPLAAGGAYAFAWTGESPSYITAPVQTGRISTAITATGTLNPVLAVELGSQLSGRMAEVLVTFNDVVRAGQPIAKLDPEIFAAKLNEAKAALKIAEANVELQVASLERANAALENAQSARAVATIQLEGNRVRFEESDKQLERKLALARSANTSEADLGRARAQHGSDAAELRAALEQIKIRDVAILIAQAEERMAKANVLNAQAVVEQKKAALEQAELDLQRTEIRAPIDGVIIKRDVNPGQMVTVSLKSETLFKIAHDLREMEVHAKIDEADVGRLKPGDPASFTVDAYPDRTFAGRILQIRKSPEVVQNVVTYVAVISAPNPHHVLFPGMTANIRVTIDQSGQVLKIPNTALRFQPGAEHSTSAARAASPTGAEKSSATVWRVGSDGKPSAVEIGVGRKDAEWSEVVSGSLTPADQVIVGIGRPRIRAAGFPIRWGW